MAGEVNGFVPGGVINPALLNAYPTVIAPPPPPPPPPPPLPAGPMLDADGNVIDAGATSLEALRGDLPGAALAGPGGLDGGAMSAAELEAMMMAMLAGAPAPGMAPGAASPTQPFASGPLPPGMAFEAGMAVPGVPGAVASPTNPFGKPGTLPFTPPKPEKKKGGLFSKIGGAIKSIGKAVVKALPIVTTVACFVPGLNAIAIPLKIATYASKAISVYQNIKSGNYLGAIMSVAPGVGGKVGDAIGRFQASGLGKAVGSAFNVYRGYRNGGVAGALAGAGSAFGPGSTVGRYLGSAGTVALGYRSGGIAGALGAGGQVMGGSVGQRLSGAFGAVSAARGGDFRTAFQGFQAALGQQRQAEIARSQETFRATMAFRNGGDPSIAARAEQLARQWFPQQYPPAQPAR